MEIDIMIKGKKDPIIFKGDRIDILDFEMNKVMYKQIRCFRNGFSKSQYIESSIIKNIRKRD